MTHVVVVTSVHMSLVLWWRRLSRIIVRVQPLCAPAVCFGICGCCWRQFSVAEAAVLPVMAYMHREHVGELYAVVSI